MLPMGHQEVGKTLRLMSFSVGPRFSALPGPQLGPGVNLSDPQFLPLSSSQSLHL